MITNVLQMLHTTAAYQTAVIHLLTGEANFAAEQLDLKETVPMVAPASDNWVVDPAPKGIGGEIASSNYYYWIHEGKLREVRERKRFHSAQPPVWNLDQLAEQVSLLDTNSAYQLATQWLGRLSIDVGELEKKYSPTIFQVRILPRSPDGQRIRGANLIDSPLFEISWGHDERFWGTLTNGLDERTVAKLKQRPDNNAPVHIEILGTTKELLSLRIRDGSLLKRPALQLTNANELLGPTPPPRHFVEEFVGGQDAYETVASPDKVEAWLLTSSFAGGSFQPKKDRVGPVKLNPVTAKQFSESLSNFDTYLWNVANGCIVDYGARVRFTRGTDVVEFWLCYECDMLEVTHNDLKHHGDFDYGHDALVKALQGAFPDDEVVKGLRLKGSRSP